MTPAERTQKARLAAHARWAREPDRSKATAPARRAALDRFERQAEEIHGPLKPKMRRKVARNLQAEHMTRMSIKAAAKAKKSRNATGGAPAQSAAVNDPTEETRDVELTRS